MHLQATHYYMSHTTYFPRKNGKETKFHATKNREKAQGTKRKVSPKDWFSHNPYLLTVTYGSDVVMKGCVIPDADARAFHAIFPNAIWAISY